MISSYNTTMAYRDIFIKEPNQEKHSGEDIHAVIDSVHKDYDKSRKFRGEIEVNNFITYHVHPQENGHDILIVTGDEKDHKSVVVQKFKCRWPKNRNPRKKPFRNDKKEV